MAQNGTHTGDQLASDNSKRRVLSIQSHVVAGYVGNKCAVFPLQVRFIIKNHKIPNVLNDFVFLRS